MLWAEQWRLARRAAYYLLVDALRQLFERGISGVSLADVCSGNMTLVCQVDASNVLQGHQLSVAHQDFIPQELYNHFYSADTVARRGPATA